MSRLVAYSLDFNPYLLTILQPILLYKCPVSIDCSSSSIGFNYFTAKYLIVATTTATMHLNWRLAVSSGHLQKRWRITREVRVFPSNNVEMGQRILHHSPILYDTLNKAFSAGLQTFWCPVYCFHGARISNDLLGIRLSRIDSLSHFLSYLF